jgi:hypothetical protein
VASAVAIGAVVNIDLLAMRSGAVSEAREMIFGRDGARCVRSALDLQALNDIDLVLPPSDKAGVRLIGMSALKPLLSTDRAIGEVASTVLGARAEPVRAILFDKTARANWKLGWHQDRTIVVKRRIDVDGYGPWSTKAGLQHVAPPFDLLADMVTLRVHLDDVSPQNAPLLIAPGSHRLGRIAEADIAGVVRKCGTFTCLAAAGDIWLYATPILHASDAAASPSRRRVLQVDYSSHQLPGGLEWLGV